MLLGGLLLVVVFVVAAVGAPWLAPYDFNANSAGGEVFGSQQPPSLDHWWGTTVGGTDVLSRVLYGARTACEVVVLAVVLSALVGIPLGLVSGFVGGWLDRVLVLVTDALYAFPSLLLAIVVSIVLAGGNSGVGAGILSAAIAITVVFIPQYFRVVRNATVAVKVEPYVDAARVVGVRMPRILSRHIFSNIAQTLPVIATLNASEAVLTLAGLGFLGFGIEPSAAAEWGYDLNKALSDTTNGIWWTGVFPGTAIVLMVLGVTLVGESLSDVLNPLLRTRGSSTTEADAEEIAEQFAGEAEPVEAEVVAATTRTGETPALELRGLTVSFDTDRGTVRAVTGADVSVLPGEVVALVGESGSGKSVSARAVLGLLPASAHVSGSVRIRGRDGEPEEVIGRSAREMQSIRGARVAMVFQEPSTALNPVYTVGWQIIEGLRIHRDLSRSAARARAVELLEMVGIPDPEARVDYYPHQLSGGQKQRVMIAIAISCEPDVIIADEPTTALDVTVQAAILDLLLELRDRLGTAILLITHNMGVVADMADRVAVMYRGSVVEQSTARELFAAPRHPYTKALLGAVPHLDQGSPSGAPATAYDGAAVLAVDSLVVEFRGRLGQPSFRAVDGVSLNIHEGEVLALVGESGSGKSTVGRCAVGLQRPTSGSVRVNGVEIGGGSDRQLRAVRQEVGFVFQDPASSLNPHMTIEQCIAEPLYVQGTASATERRARVAEMVDLVQLGRTFLTRYPHELSGGQRQRVSLARALALDPRLLIADEPTSALDVSVQARVLELFAQLQGELRFACLFITHDLAVVDQLADRVAVMEKGRVVELGTRDQVLRAPSAAYTQRLVAAVPVPDPEEQQRRRREARAALAVP
jgi:ABC-type glutathione transport system ATPase component/ABC-type dipeptide/oligopeptide/nickel transport system permease subunit